MTTRWRCSPRRKATPAACPTFNATSAVILLLARPRMPSVPKYLRAMRVNPVGRIERQLREIGFISHIWSRKFHKSFLPVNAPGRRCRGHGRPLEWLNRAQEDAAHDPNRRDQAVPRPEAGNIGIAQAGSGVSATGLSRKLHPVDFRLARGLRGPDAGARRRRALLQPRGDPDRR